MVGPSHLAIRNERLTLKSAQRSLDVENNDDWSIKPLCAIAMSTLFPLQMLLPVVRVDIGQYDENNDKPNNIERRIAADSLALAADVRSIIG